MSIKREKRHYETIIVGGGIVGAACAYFLSKAGREVLLIERGTIACGSSGACDGTIFIQSKPQGPKLDMAIRSAKLFEELARQLKYDFEYEKEGGLILIETEEEEQFIQQRLAFQRKSGALVRMLRGQELHSKLPGLTRRVDSASWCPDDAKINPMKATVALLEAARDKGCDLLKQTEVTEMLVRDSSVYGVRALTAGSKLREITCRYVVNACGVWAPQLSAMVGINTPIRPRKGELLVTEAVEPFIKPAILEARYIMAKQDPTTRKGIGFVLEQTKRGTLILGSSREFIGFNRTSTWSVAEAIAQRTVHFFPALRGLRVVRSYSGLRPFTADGLPYLGECRSVRGFLMASGHEGDGVALSAETGRCISHVICDGGCDTLAPFAPERSTPASR